MAKSNILPGYGIVQETATSQNLLPGYGILNESVSVAPASSGFIRPSFAAG